MTGATGFLGTALVERLLRSVPGCRIAVLVRPTRRLGASERARREIVRNDCFDRLRSELGDAFEQMVADRLTAVAGDVSSEGLGLDDAGVDLLAASDIVVHSAAAVAFDAPLDAAVEVNLLGPSRVAAAICDATTRRADALPDRPPTHLITVSTAYVAGTHQGHATETLATDAMRSGARARTHTTVTTEVDIDAEIGAARRLRADLEAASRTPSRLTKFTKRARNELGGAGTHLLAERAEKLREDWVRAELVEAGRSRAQALGWPDAYAFTKALGERMLVTRYPDVPTTVVRPSIIESALAEPRPGWIRGFRMAEPIIISYARGLLKAIPRGPRRRYRRGACRHGRRRDHRVCGGGSGPGWHPSGACRFGRPQSPALRASGRSGAVVVHGASGLRRRRPTHRGSRLVVPRAGTRPTPAGRAPTLRSVSPRDCSAHFRCEESAPTWPPVSKNAVPSQNAPSVTCSCTAPTQRPRLFSGSTGFSSSGTGSAQRTAKCSASTLA